MKICTKCKIEKQFTEFNKQLSAADGLYPHCKPCRAATDAARYAANREKWASHYADNRDRIAAVKAVYYAANRERIAAYRAKNRERIAAACAASRAAKPEKYAAKDRNRRARKLKAEGSHTAADVRAIFEKQKGLCANCHNKLFKSGKNKFHIDHIMPLVLGGSNWPSNLQCLCPTCNLSKGAKNPDTWAKQQGRLI